MLATLDASAEDSCSILGMRVDETDNDRAIARIMRWTAERSSRYVCISTVHMVMESYDDADFRAIVNGADLVAADGMPLIWLARHLGRNQGRVFAPTFTPDLCRVAAERGIRVGFFGSSDAVLTDLVANLRRDYPTLQIPYVYSPPFRPLSDAEDEAIVEAITEAGVQILFVGLGCPKQERWMAAHRGRIAATMLGVGWAFDVVAGHSKMAPEWIQRAGMEWFYRLLLTPKRLWRRHLKNNPRFLALVGWQLMQRGLAGRRAS